MRRDPDRAGEGHVLTVPELTFTGDEWHQVIGTWSGINGGPDAGRLDLYFDGVHVGRMDRFEHRLEWRLDDWEIRIGLGFAGRIDDFFILDRELSAQEADELHAAQVPFGQFCAGR
jgi:hypothetical protein